MNLQHILSITIHFIFLTESKSNLKITRVFCIPYETSYMILPRNSVAYLEEVANNSGYVFLLKAID